MPNAHFACAACETTVLLVYVVADVGGPSWPPVCTVCGRGVLELAPQAGDFAFDLKTDGDGGKGFQKFTVQRQQPQRDGTVAHVEEQIDSVHKLRQIERDSEQRYRNGEGEPLRFRAYANDHSNMDRGSFGTEGVIGGRAYDSGATPKKKFTTVRHGQQKPKVAVAKGGGVTAL